MRETSSRLRTALADRYRVERELGAGGMATVYLAHDIKHDRDVAIKVLHPDLGAALGGERFLSEIRTTARLQHPHILPLLDSGDADADVDVFLVGGTSAVLVGWRATTIDVDLVMRPESDAMLRAMYYISTFAGSHPYT